ncbi:MAG: hypothetical protein AABY22_19320 [Nanoarchaeota archaeon]
MKTEEIYQRYNLEDGYLLNPLIPSWWEESGLGGSCKHLKNERINLFNRTGDKYLLAGSASKHLVEIVLDDPNNPDRKDKDFVKSLLYFGNFVIYNQNVPILDGRIWNAIPFPNHQEFPHFLDLLIGKGRVKNNQTDAEIIKVMEKYRESLAYYQSLESERMFDVKS